ncbi:MAG TPA: FtsX-like permease family protein [Hyphomicrobiaceae bacterium]|jgi:putative ABC transport system permease protein|nr:FtsX-like permease family protein [Hyphomicrobiaceae bacterium]
MTAAATLDRAIPAKGGMVPLVLALALRELRNGLRGFYVFIACVALGVAAITAVGALADALRAGFEAQGQVLLGGDVTLARPHKPADAAARAWLNRQGAVSEVATLRAMARRPDGTEQALVELRGVDAAYPLVGTVQLSDAMSLTEAVREEPGAAVDQILLERLALKVGDRLSIGRIEVPIRATIESEPDKVLERFNVGPRVLVSLDTLRSSGLIEPGSLVTWRYALKLAGNAGASDAGLVEFREAVKRAVPEGGFSLRDRRDPAPQVSRTLDRLRQFLTLVGLTALLVGGVGIANAVATYIDRRRRVIATFKSLGATTRTIFGVHLLQVLAFSVVGVAVGMAAGLLVPIALVHLLGNSLPIRAELALTTRSLATAAAYGFLVVLLFTLWPLGRAGLVRAGVLFRDEVAPERRLPGIGIAAATLVAAMALVGLAILTSEAPRLALYYCLAVIGVFAAFWGLGSGVTWLARRVPRPRGPELALAVRNLGAPGGLTRAVVLSLGAGLSLLVSVALVDHSIVSDLTGRMPEKSPSYFVLDLKRSESESFQALVHERFPEAKVQQAPMLRGRMVKLGDTPVEKVKAPPEAGWVLTGDRGLTYSATLPEDAHVVEGAWWPADYAGEPLVSFDIEIAKGLGLKVGDTVTVNVLGRNVAARVANLREVKWESLSLNFVMVFSPNTLAGAPHNLLTTITLPRDAALADEAKLARDIGKVFPSTTAIRVKDAIAAFNVIFERIMVAVRAAGSVTLLAGALVLAGALATAQRRRIKQAVILKTLGATRRRILASHLVEYAILALATSAIALIAGTIAAWITTSGVMDFYFSFSWSTAAQAILLALALVAVFGGYGTWRVLREPAVPYLRSE